MPANDSRDGNPVVAEPAATERAIHSEAPAPVAAALLDWQRMGDSDRFGQLIAAVRPKAESVVTGVLKRRGIRDPLAIDEAVALVLDHLRRLSPAPGEPRNVKPFQPAVRPTPPVGLAKAELPPADPDAPAADSGLTYVARLARHRAVDVARRRYRQARKSVVFSQLEAADSRLLDRTVAKAQAPGDSAPDDDHSARLADALPQLPPRERLVVELLLAGKSQSVVAHLLGVCEGTVSRLRTKALARLRLLLAE